MLGSIYAMIGVALTLSIGVLKFLNFSIPGLFMIGGMSCWVLIRHGMPYTSMPPWPTLADQDVSNLAYFLTTFSPDFSNAERVPQPVPRHRRVAHFGTAQSRSIAAVLREGPRK